jgi:hypothetical protein
MRLDMNKGKITAIGSPLKLKESIKKSNTNSNNVDGRNIASTY